jgi:hypothetical protein
MPVTAMLVRWVGGWTETSIGGRRREATLGLGAQQSEAEAIRVANAQLAVFGDARTEVAVDLKPMTADDTPWLAFRVGDYIAAPEWDGTNQDQRVMSLTAAVDDNGMITYSTELKDRILGERERTEQTMKKMTNGTLRGASKVATPTGMIGKRNIPPRPRSGPE